MVACNARFGDARGIAARFLLYSQNHAASANCQKRMTEKSRDM
jgi:hypothetical protein